MSADLLKPTATLGTAFVAGIQGPAPFYRRAEATPKYFAARCGR